MNVQALSQVSGSGKIAKTMHSVCPSSQFCVVRALFWAAVNFGMIAPAMS